MEKDYEGNSYTAQAKGEHYQTEVLKAITAVGYVERADLPSGFLDEHILVLNDRFAEDNLPKRLKFVGTKLMLVRVRTKNAPRKPKLSGRHR